MTHHLHDPAALNDLLTRLPAVKGRMTPNAPLAPFVWFRVGGPAQILFKPSSLDDLQTFLQKTPQDIPVTVLGAGSNVLIREGGIPGVVVKLGRPFSTIGFHETTLVVGAAALDSTVALSCEQHGLTGLEFMIGVPGTVGGAVRMNAGAYEQETKDTICTVTAIDRKGVLHKVDQSACGFTYRSSTLPQDWIILEATFQLEKAPQPVISERMQAIRVARTGSQPVRARTGGSTFKNPKGHKAWELIDQAGCRGLRHGGAMISEQHCNFLINTGDATASDLERVGEMTANKVYAMSGIQLEWELKRLGVTT